MGLPSTTRWRLKQLITDRLTDIDVSENFIVGRSGDAKLCLRSSKASRTHAAFVINAEDNLLVQDLKSINGTFVNGTQIKVYILHRVFPTDTISFGLANIDLAEDDRDRQSFFKVLQVEEPPVQDVADSTTNVHESSISNSVDLVHPPNTTEELKPDSLELPSQSDKIENHLDIIEISSSTSGHNDADVGSGLDNETKPETPRKTRQNEKGKASRISNRRNTIKTDLNQIQDQPKQSSAKKKSRKKSIATESAGNSSNPEKFNTKATDGSDDLLVQLDNAISGNTIQLDNRWVKEKPKQEDANENRSSETVKVNHRQSDKKKKHKDQKISDWKGKQLLGKKVDLTKSIIKKNISENKGPNPPEKIDKEEDRGIENSLQEHPNPKGSHIDCNWKGKQLLGKKVDLTKSITKKDISENKGSNPPEKIDKEEDRGIENSLQEHPNPKGSHIDSNWKGKQLLGKKVDLTKSIIKKNIRESKGPNPPEKIDKEEDRGIENSLQEHPNPKGSHIDSKPVPKTTDKSFTTDNDNSVIIDITGDNDDDIDFSCSQIFQMSQIVKTEGLDDAYQKIKNELAEMDFFEEEIIINPVPINLEEDFDNSGFENTQDICAFLQDGIEANPEAATAKPSEVLEAKTPSLTPSPVNVPPSNADKLKNTIPPIIEPHTLTKATQKLRQSPRRKNTDIGKEKPSSRNKRKTSMETPVEKKKSRANLKVSPINPLAYNSKEIMTELKRRHSSSGEIDKAEKLSIREERRKKLKELTSTTKPEETTGRDEASTSKDGSHPEEDATLTAHVLGTRRIALSPKIQTRGDARKTSADATAKAVAYGNLKPIDVPPHRSSHNLRRAKSSDDIKFRKPNAVPIAHHNRPSTRHSCMADVNGQPSTSSRVRTARVDPRTAQLIEKPIRSQIYPNDVPPQDASRRLMWTNGGPGRRATPRRLANVDDITNKMVQWLPDWLLEQVDIDASPPVNDPPATSIPLNFRDFNHYHDTFSKLVLLENWQYLFKGFREPSDDPRQVKIEHMRVVNDLIILDCVCYISKQELKKGLFYKPEDFLLLECVRNDRSNCYRSVNFGLVQNCRKSTISDGALISIQLGNLCAGDPHTQVEFSVLTRYQPQKEINPRRWPIVKLLANIRAHLMLIRAVKGIAQSPLCSMILNPKMNDFKYAVIHRDIIQPHNLNSQQMGIVLEAASLCTGNNPGIYCVKGPPGTGKSTVIVNLIFQILFSHQFAKTNGKPPMILLAAPSNTAVDNLISKLVALKHSLRPELKQQIKCVRIGPESSISKEVIGYSLPKLAEKHVPLKNANMPQFKAARDRNENLLEFSKTFFGDQYSHELKMCENLIIEKSNIICTTLNSCINGRLIEAGNRGLIEFTCCIIDEATQCHEVESLLPTILGIDKVVLVGDPQQLNATIMNRDALRLGFGQSLFTRLANNFRNDPRSPIKMLTEQYRMHPEICSFPNRQFYDGKLRTVANPTNKLPEEIRPYLVFNCEKASHATDYTNMDEVVLIKKLLATIFSTVQRNLRYTVGIITPYNAQKDLICKNIADLVASNENCKITTNTVDSFQGSENDIVIISCVRDSSNSFLQNENRLNVALTRAKQALYIIGNYTLFKECRPLYDLREDAKRRKVLLDIKQNPRSIRNFNKYLLWHSDNSSDKALYIDNLLKNDQI